MKLLKTKADKQATKFQLRILKSGALSMGIISASLGIGVFGYQYFGQLSLVDALLNASMILTGMGPVNVMQTVAGKLFSSIYALFSGIVFLSTIAVFLSPILHQIMHDLHLEDQKNSRLNQ